MQKFYVSSLSKLTTPGLAYLNTRLNFTYIHEPCSPAHGVCISCVLLSTHTALFKIVQQKAFHPHSSFDPASCMPLLLPRPSCTQLSTLYYPYAIYIIIYVRTIQHLALVNYRSAFVCIFFCLQL